jgi:hypothetical protein
MGAREIDALIRSTGLRLSNRESLLVPPQSVAGRLLRTDVPERADPRPRSHRIDVGQPWGDDRRGDGRGPATTVQSTYGGNDAGAAFRAPALAYARTGSTGRG